MADPIPNPAPVKTIRVGTEMFDDVQDFILIVRDKENKVTSRTSSFCWAHGAMEQTLAIIYAHNDDVARGEGDPDA